MSNLFSGLFFWDSEGFLRDVILSLEEIRKKAFKQKLIWEPESQFMSNETVEELKSYFNSDDNLSILINIYRDSHNKLSYLEQPYIPVKTIIKRKLTIELLYWQVIPTIWDAEGNIKKYGEIRFGFLSDVVPGLEFSSMCFAQLVVEKFYQKMMALKDKFEMQTLGNGTQEIGIDGALKAKFYKAGRKYDVEFI